MTTLASRGSRWMARSLEAVAGAVVKYRRGAADCELTAIPGRRVADGFQENPPSVVVELFDWILDPARLVIESEAITPQLGDLVIHDGTTFAVVIGDDEECWRWCDQYRQRIRVHTVERQPTGEDE